MSYGDVIGRGLTTTYGQYPGFRDENSVIAAWLGRVPHWPIVTAHTLLDEWDFGTFRLQKIAYSTEPGVSVRRVSSRCISITTSMRRVNPR